MSKALREARRCCSLCRCLAVSCNGWPERESMDTVGVYGEPGRVAGWRLSITRSGACPSWSVEDSTSATICLYCDSGRKGETRKRGSASADFGMSTRFFGTRGTSVAKKSPLYFHSASFFFLNESTTSLLIASRFLFISSSEMESNSTFTLNPCSLVSVEASLAISVSK